MLLFSQVAWPRTSIQQGLFKLAHVRQLRVRSIAWLILNFEICVIPSDFITGLCQDNKLKHANPSPFNAIMTFNSTVFLHPLPNIPT